MYVCKGMYFSSFEAGIAHSNFKWRNRGILWNSIHVTNCIFWWTEHLSQTNSLRIVLLFSMCLFLHMLDTTDMYCNKKYCVLFDLICAIYQDFVFIIWEMWKLANNF